MSQLTDLEERIKTAEAALSTLKTELEALKQEQPEPAPLLGRWATHKEYGRGIIASNKPDTSGEVEFAFSDAGDRETQTTSFQVPLDELDLYPVTFTTTQDFQDAPAGTIIEATTDPRDVYVKTGGIWYVVGDTEEANPIAMPVCRVIRWGNGK